MVELRAQAEARALKLDEKYRALKEQVRSRHEKSWKAMAESWHEGMRRATEELDAVEREVVRLRPALGRPGLDVAAAPPLIPPVIRSGEITLDLRDLPGGISPDSRLMEGIRTRFTFPACGHSRTVQTS